MDYIAQLASPDWLERSEAAKEIAKRRPRLEDIPALRTALHDEYDVVARYAAHALGKLGPKAQDAVDDLIAAATIPWVFGCPQRFPSAITALVKINPENAQLIAICKHCLSCQNYGVQKAAVQALERIASSEAMGILRNINDYRDTSIQCSQWYKLMAKVLAGLE